MYKHIFITALLITISITVSISQLKCTQPQKAFYMSYYAMGKRDTLGNLFTQINEQIGKYNSTYTDEKSNIYLISYLHPQMYYNEHHQLEQFIDDQHVNVSLGDIELAFKMNYQIRKGTQISKGMGRGRVLVDQHHFFTKRLMVVDGILEWDAVTISNLSVNSLIAFDFSEPKLQLEDKLTFENMINDHIGQLNLKNNIVNTFNSEYQELLKKHLNDEHIIPTLNFEYTYKNITINYTNAVQSYKLENATEKGLRVKMFLQVQGHTQNCTNDTIAFNEKEHGGLQGLISLSTLSQSFRYALENGLYSAQIDKKWEVPHFQFYMGDLGNFIPEANKYPADDPFTASCHWDGDHDSIKFTTYSQFQLYAQTGMKCTLKYKSNDIVKVSFELNIVAKVIAEEKELVFLVDSGTIYNPKFETVDSKFKVIDEDLASYMLTQVVAGFKGMKGFGSGFQTGYRYFPAAVIVQNYLLIFDAALQ